VEIFATRTFGDGSAAVRLSDGDSNSLSADFKWVMGLASFNLNHLIFLPTGTGQAQTINLGTLGYHWGNWLPNGHQILFQGNEPGYGSRIYLMDFPQARPRPVTAEESGWSITLTLFPRMASRSWAWILREILSPIRFSLAKASRCRV
jgi:hypothetical protein